MDSGRGSGKTPVMSFSMKYNANQEEVKELFSNDGNDGSPKQSDQSVPDALNLSKKIDKSSSILNKYLKSFKTSDKVTEDSSKLESNLSKDNIEKKNLDTRNESSGSPIKEYFSKFSKRSDSIDTSSDVDSLKDKDSTVSTDRWKIFNEFKSKITQAVSKASENTDSKEKPESIDSEDNSLTQDIDLNSCTDNQVSSLASSIQNLSELSPPIISISHSSTMTDIDMETNSSDTNKQLTETLESGHRQYHAGKHKKIKYEESDDEQMEIESGVEALEDAELVLDNDTPVKYSTPIHNIVIKPNVPEFKQNIRVKSLIFDYTWMASTTFVLFWYIIFPKMVLFNGILIGIWISYFVKKLLKYFSGDNQENSVPQPNNYNFSHAIPTGSIPYIVEFQPLKKHTGWINIFMLGKYDLQKYHISLTQTVFMKLEGSILRISFTHNKIPKRALWDESHHKVPFFQHRIYNLEGAKIMLLPIGIIKKRYWSKKYPICIVLKDKSKMTVYNAKSEDGADIISADTPCLPLFSNDEFELKEIEKDDKNSSLDVKGSIDMEELKVLSTSKSSPKRSLFEKKTDKLLASPMRNEDSETETTSCIKTLTKAVKCTSDLKENDKDFNATVNPHDVLGEEHKEFFDPSNDTCENENSIGSNNAEVLSKEWIKDDFIYDEQNNVSLYLFGRTGREKEEWFYMLKAAIEDANIKLMDETDESIPVEDDVDVTQNLEPYDSLGDELSKLIATQRDGADSKVRMGNLKTEKKLIGSNDSPSVLWTPSGGIKDTPLVNNFCPKQDVNFWHFMKDIIEAKSSDDIDTKLSYDVLWFNALFSRIIFDTFRNEAWVIVVQERIQKKLMSLKLPSFMGPLVISDLKFGSDVPKFHSASNPTLDNRGLWIDFNVSFTGLVTMTLLTQLNLMSLIEKRDDVSEESGTPKHISKPTHAVYHSDLDDTAESSSEDEAELVQPQITKNDPEFPVSPSNVGNSSAKKIMRYVDKIASNKYFQHVTEYKYVKRAMEGVSSTDIKLQVDVCSVVGCLAINIPPPPSDRIWFGFRGNPQLLLKAKPVLGSRVINWAYITTWIENKLCKEFEKILVLPNMEDIYLNCMTAPCVI